LSRSSTRPTRGAPSRRALERARDELFYYIRRSGVLQASEEDREAWMAETVEFLRSRYPDLTSRELEELRTIGLRFCRPPVDARAAASPSRT